MFKTSLKKFNSRLTSGQRQHFFWKIFGKNWHLWKITGKSFLFALKMTHCGGEKYFLSSLNIQIKKLLKQNYISSAGWVMIYNIHGIVFRGRVLYTHICLTGFPYITSSAEGGVPFLQNMTIDDIYLGGSPSKIWQ